MSEEQFWRANPRIIKVWEKAFREKENWKNGMYYILGIYMHDAFGVVLGNAFKKKGAKPLIFHEEPIRIFPKTEEEIKLEKERELQKFIAWADKTETNVKIRQGKEKKHE